MVQRNISGILGFVLSVGLLSCTSSQVHNDRWPAGSKGGGRAAVARSAPVPRPTPSPGAFTPGQRSASRAIQAPMVAHAEVPHVNVTPNHSAVVHQNHNPGTAPAAREGHEATVGQEPRIVHTQHTVENLGDSASRATIVNHDKQGHEVGHTVIETHKDGSYVRTNTTEGERYEHDAKGLNRMTITVHDDKGTHEQEVFHESINRQVPIPRFGNHDLIQRQYWDQRTYNYVAWRNQMYWGLRLDWVVFNWSAWQPTYWTWYCGDVLSGPCVTPQTQVWDWHWQWRADNAYHYNSASEWYTDYLFGRYWLYRHEDEVEVADAYWMQQLNQRRPYEYFDPATQALIRSEVDFAIREAHSNIYFQPVQLIGRNRAYFPGVDYAVNLTGSVNNDVCVLTRGSVVKIDALPLASNPYAVARVVHAHDTHDGAVFCNAGTRVSIPVQDLIDMSNDFRSRVQDGLSAKEEIDNGQTLQMVLRLNP